MEAAVWTVQQLQFVGRANAVAAPQQAVSDHRSATGAVRLDDDNRYDLAKGLRQTWWPATSAEP